MGSLTLPSDGLIYLDAAVVIYSVEKIEPYWSLLEPMWLAAQTGNFTLFGSELLVLETLVKPLQENDRTYAVRVFLTTNYTNFTNFYPFFV